MRWISLISSGHSIPVQKNTPLLKCIWNILQDRPHLGSQSNLSKFKKIEIVSNIFNHNPMRLDINCNKKKNCKKHKHMEIKQHISK